jgi:hypothetical protein
MSSDVEAVPGASTRPRVAPEVVSDHLREGLTARGIHVGDYAGGLGLRGA